MRRLIFLPALCLASLAALTIPAFAQSAGSSGQSALETQAQIDQLQSQIRDLTGQIQVLGHNLDELKDQLNRLSNDVDMRFSQLQPTPPSTTAPPAPAKAGSAAAPVRQAQPSLGPAPHTLGTLPAAPPSAAPGAAAAGNLPPGSAEDQYNYAMGLLKQANYPAAEQAMREFVQRWPKDPLAGNAQYWLGETFYVRGDYTNAATAFAQGYEKYPRGAKAPDDLLKLGMSLANLKQKADACHAYAHLEHDFPHASQAMKERLADEKKRAGC